ncbi:hypothetical protein OIU76_017643 [Salix suchowensis]|nr:hypothetical protein OIU76_017643 [Salix suchowensis]
MTRESIISNSKGFAELVQSFGSCALLRAHKSSRKNCKAVVDPVISMNVLSLNDRRTTVLPVYKWKLSLSYNSDPQPLDCYTLQQDYANALEKSILFFEGQRSGKLPSNQRLTWRGDSGLSDGSSYHVNLAGGYYDAGDNVKFGLPMAFTTTLLAWSVIEFGSSMQNQIENAKAAIRWSTDYLLKAATATPDTLYVQVGDPNLDHQCWERPEDMDTPRNVYKVTTQNPGSDVAAETAAALAAASIVFKDSDSSYSAKLAPYGNENRYRGSYSSSLSSAVCPFYCSYSGYQDELLWGASWIHRASQNGSYLAYIQSNGHTMGSDDDDYSFSWDDKRPGTKILLSKEFLEKTTAEFQLYKSHSDNYICSLIPGTSSFQAQYTPGGLFYKASESNLQYVTSTTFLLLTYAKYLGSNGGVARCGGSTVTAEDNFADDRNNYQQSEPATYINAPFVGALAFFSAKN